MSTSDPNAETLPTAGEVSTGEDRARSTAAAPARVGRFVVIDELGAGGMGVVYAAYDPELDRKVALKLMYPEHDGARAHRGQSLLLREAQALAKLSHPNIVAIHDVGVHDGQVFVAMEFVAGRTLRRWREEAARDWRAIVAAFVQAGRGLMAAHAVGLVHRDVKPDNLLIGEDDRVRVADFGVARYRAPSDAEVTAPMGAGGALMTVAERGALVGTPAYMSPEQLAGAEIGPQSDQFSFCVALYEALHGVRPFTGETTTALAGAIRRGPQRRGPGAGRHPAWLERVVLRGLAPSPADRWPSMEALLAALRPDRDSRRARWRWRALYAALVVVGGAALILGGRALQASRARAQAERAAEERLKVVAEGIERLLARGRRAEAEEALRAFVGEPEHRTSRAAIDAWLLWADHMDALDDREAVLTALVEAYTGLPEGDPREPAIFLRIARIFRAHWRFDELAVLARHAGERWPEELATPAWAELRADTALARRDLGGFLAELASGRIDPARGAVAPLVRALDAASFPRSGGHEAFAVDLEGDGRLEVAVFTPSTPEDLLSVHRMDAALTPIRDLGRDLGLDNKWLNRQRLNRGPGEPAHIVAWKGGRALLYELDERGPRVVFAWEDDGPQSTAAADLDGDGVRELYVGTASYTRKLYRLTRGADGQWQRTAAHPATDGLGSDVNALVAGDFDGDGRDELAVALGPWRAYEVRVLQGSPGGGVELGARRRIGHVRALATLRGADGATLLAIAKDNHASSKLAFAPSEPDGEPSGLYVVRRRGRALETVFHAPLPLPAGETTDGHVRWMGSGDLDGDGLDDLVLRYEASGRREFASGLLFRQLADGSFAPLAIGHLPPLTIGQFDGDPAAELLVMTPRGDAPGLAVLGAGGAPLAPIPAQRVVASPPGLADPVLSRAWARAEDLVSFGLYTAAADALERRLPLAQTPEDRRAVQRRLAALYAAAGDHARAAAGHEALAQDGDDEAALAAIDGYERALRLDDALRVARQLLRRGDLTPARRDQALAASERLAAVVEHPDALEIRFDAPLAEPWRIHDPLALRLDRVRGALAVDAFADAGDLMSVPIEVTGDALIVELELAVERAEWAGQLAVVLRRESGEEVLALGVMAGGGGGYLRRYGTFRSPDSYGPQSIGSWDTDDPSEASAHVLRARLLPDQRSVEIEVRGDHPERRSFPMIQRLAAGRHLLVLRGAGVDNVGAQQLRAAVRRISIAGARLGASRAPLAPRERVAAALVAGRLHEVLAGAEGPGVEALWRASAAAELGRLDEAIAALRGVDPEDPELRRLLRHLLRARPRELVPLLRAAFGPRYAGLLRESLATATQMHLDPALQRIWLTAAADLEALPADGAAEIDAKAELLAMRAAVWREVGDLEQAAADLDLAVDLQRRSAGERDERLAELEVRRAEIAAAAGRTEAALDAVARALALSLAPDLLAERLRINARLSPLQDQRRWRGMVDLGLQEGAEDPR